MIFRFTMPEKAGNIPEKAKAICIQIEDFLHTEALQELLGILETDIDTIGRKYNRRRVGNGAVVETQELQSEIALKKKREMLYPLFRELGFIDINKPIKNKNRHIIVLGGSMNACIERTECARAWIDETTRLVDGLACYRPISYAEKMKANRFNCDTEFGAMSECFANVFALDRTEYTERFKGDRNLNSISCIRIYEKADDCTFRIFAAPSSEPGIRRADTGDTFRFFMDTDRQTGAEESYLFITHNRYCNRQFLQLAYPMIVGRLPGTIDVIGCYPDDHVVSEEKYDPIQYLQDLIGIIDWGFRFREAADHL